MTIQHAWAAGIIDGEGSFGIHRQKAPSVTQSPTYRFFLQVGMTHEPTVRMLHEIFELGSVAALKPQGKWSQAWLWRVHGTNALAVTGLVLPFLVTKREEALIGVEFMTLPQYRGGAGKRIPDDDLRKRDDLYVRLREAKGSSRFRPIESWYE